VEGRVAAGAPETSRLSVRAEGRGAAAVRAIGLRKTYGPVVALERLDLEVRAGEFFTLLGPSGSGKTTTLRLIGGFEQPDSGAIELAGRDVTRDPPFQRDVNTVFQDYALFPHMSVAENVAYGLMIRKVGRRERARRAQEALELVRLPDLGARRPIQLSGGQRQRVALARALVNRPTVLLLDEPLGALDLKLRQEMQIELQRIQRDLDEPVTFLYVTHDQEEALTMSDRIAVFSAGRIEQVGTPADVYERPANEFVAGFVGTSNVLVRDGARFTVRPEKIRILGLDEPAPDGDVESAVGTVREVVYVGPVTRFIVDLDEGRTLVALRQNLDTSAGEALEERGRRVRLAWHPEHAFAVAPVSGDPVTSEEEEKS
jgi:putative spermidine/putrescine transport system ATP-binding protein